MEENSKICPKCSATVSSDIKYCPNCGYNLTSAGSVQTPQPAFTAGGRASAPRDGMMNAIAGRGATDERMDTIWALLPILAWVVTIAASISALFLGFVAGLSIRIIAGIVAGILLAVLSYKLIKRQSGHILREAQMRRATIDYLRIKGAERGASNNVEQYLSAMDAIDREMTFNEKPRDPVLWAILSIIIPFVSLYVLYFLTKYTFDHDRRLNSFAQNAQLAGAQLGLDLAQPNWRPVHDRSFILYLILSIVTLGLFVIYWYYVLITDMNEHFDNEWLFEDQLAREIQKV